MARHLIRDAALPITWLLLHTHVTANQVTAFSLLAGILGAGLLALPGTGFFLAGGILLQGWYLLDHVDGQIARYRKTASLTGRFFDFMTHHILHAVIFFSLGFYGLNTTGQGGFVIWGFVTSLSIIVFNVTHDARDKTFVEHLKTFRRLEVLGEEGQEKKASKRSLAHRCFSWLHKACEVHVVMNLLTLVALLQTLTQFQGDFRIPLFSFYGVVVPLVMGSTLTHRITRRKVDEEFGQLFRPIGS